MAKQTYCVILAAGWSRRMGPGTQKLLLPVDGHVPMIRHVVKTALESKVAKTFVVVNPAFPAVAEALRHLPVCLLPNCDADLGMSTSFRLGITTLHKESADAGLFLLGDMPSVTSDIINRILSSYEASESAVVQACYNGLPGHPVLFDKLVFTFAQEVTGDEGGRRLVSQFKDRRILVEMGASCPQDVDTLADYKNLISGLEKGLA